MHISCIDSPQLQKAAATWILKTREVHRIPLSVMDSIIQDVQSLYAIALSSLSGQVTACLESADVPRDVLDSVTTIFSNPSQVFEGLQTQQQQLSYFRTNFNFVVRCLVHICSCTIEWK